MVDAGRPNKDLVLAPALRPFKHRLLSFPQASIEHVNKMIRDGKGADKIVKWLLDRHPGMDVPKKTSVQDYINYRRGVDVETADSSIKMRLAADYTEEELARLRAELDVVNLDPNDKRKVLERTLRFLLLRIHHLANIQDKALNPMFEQTIVSQLSLVKAIVESMGKLEKASVVNDLAARLVVEKAFSELANILQGSVIAVCGNEKGKEVIQRLLKDRGRIDFERIKREAIEEANKSEVIIHAVNGTAVRPDTN